MNKFTAVQETVIRRRSVKPTVLNGKKIDDLQIRQLLDLANWAPTHANTEPWRFVVYSGNAVQRFCHEHAELYRQYTAPDKFTPAKYEKQRHNGDKASHLIVVYMKRGNNPNITALEEICAAAAAVENILLGAEALGIAVLWSTGGMLLHPVMKDYFELGNEDVLLGMLYMGYADEPVNAGKRGPVEEKTSWHR
ncbi:MAG TPA: nitroreductase [Puia sp.]|uniref:nitroreductase family protein n=1 Tax=Puia sp. TaxID=2045100 RepID=UPI002C06FB1D|nr:nitroreductase [Puia sp.]HVU93845.1 nitroreductase [Puia sp.]